MPLQATSGAASYDGFGGGVAAVPNYIEDVFSTYLYTGTGATQTITNGIDLSTKGGLVWGKSRDAGTYVNHNLFDTVSGFTKILYSNTTNAQNDLTSDGAIALSNGFTIKAGQQDINSNTKANVSWTFREQPKFFDIVTYTGTGSARTVAHSLGAVPGCIIVKRTDSTANWEVFHRAIQSTPASSADYAIQLNLTNAAAISSVWDSGTPPTATVFTVGSGATVNASGGTYVAYLFAHDAGGFGLTGTDNVISCGSFTTVASEATINLGYEPQWVMVKSSSASGTNWQMYDTMRGFNGGNFTATTTAALNANSSSAESITGDAFPTATGFVFSGAASATYIYIAIRRGPMKVPTLGTSVFGLNVATSGTVTTNFAVDSQIFYIKGSNDTIVNGTVVDRLRGAASTTVQQGNYLQTSSTNAELNTYPYMSKSWSNTGFGIPDNTGGSSTVYWSFRRAPGFFDEVCYTGTGASITLNHNLGVIPEIIITKKRIDNTGSGSAGWIVMSSAYSGGFISGGSTSFGQLQSSAAVNIGAGSFLQSTPTSTTIPLLGTNYAATDAFVAYLFATCAGVSKVFSYTGNGSSQTINCGFTGGARFVLIKRTDSTGDWYVWDSARGIVAGNDPHLSLNTTAAEVTTDDSVDTDTTGFIVNQVAATNVNVSSATYIGLAIA